MSQPFPEAIRRLLAEAADALPPHAKPLLVDPTLVVHKASALWQASCCAMTDATGENHCTHDDYTIVVREAAPRVSWHRRLVRRWRLRLGESCRRLAERLLREPLYTEDEWDDRREDW